MSIPWFASFIIIALSSFAAASQDERSCNGLASDLRIENGLLLLTEYHQINTSFPLTGQVESCGGPEALANITANLCRIVVKVSTSTTSSVQIEGWLPDKWNNRSLSTGNGGIGGCIDYPTIQNGVALGFAAFGSNGGHNGSEGFEFFLNKPEVLNDFGYRSVHVEAEVAKAVVQQYYGKAPKKNYYAGCSTGGRQAFQSALLYPEDFDGVLAGSPGVDWLHVVSSKGIIARRIGWPHIDGPGYVRQEQWAEIVKQQIRLFDPLDGVKDGIIDDPTMFRFDPEVLACGTGVLNQSLCLTAEQVISVRSAYEPITDSKGNLVYPPFELGSNTDVFSDNVNVTTGKPELSYTILDDYFRGAIYNDSSWNALNFSTEDMDTAVRINPGRVNTYSYDLGVYRRKGGKILAYHGRNDQTVTSALSSTYFSGVADHLNLTLDEIHAFYRLFYIPGMHHCSGGPGAWNVGQTSPLDMRVSDPKHNALLALVDWVENDRPPESLVGTKYENDVGGSSGEIAAQRTYCPYPQRSIWDGKGATREAASWTCDVQ